jgi:hypothetical protein
MPDVLAERLHGSEAIQSLVHLLVGHLCRVKGVKNKKGNLEDRNLDETSTKLEPKNPKIHISD